MNNASLVFLSHQRGGGGEPLELNRPICAVFLRAQTFLMYLPKLDRAVIQSLQILYSC